MLAVWNYHVARSPTNPPCGWASATGTTGLGPGSRKSTSDVTSPAPPTAKPTSLIGPKVRAWLEALRPAAVQERSGWHCEWIVDASPMTTAPAIEPTAMPARPMPPAIHAQVRRGLEVAVAVAVAVEVEV